MNLSSIIKFEKNGQALDQVESFKKKLDDDLDFVSYESFWQGRDAGEADSVDPREQLRVEQEKVKRQCEDMLDKARQEAENVEQEAYDKGFARGEEEGRTTGSQAYDERLAQTAALISELEKEQIRVHHQYEGELLLLITTMVDRLVGHEVLLNSTVISSCLRHAMEYVVADSTVRVHLHPHDVERIHALEQESSQGVVERKGVVLIEDDEISEGGCFLHTDFGEIDATLEKRRERLFAAVEEAFQAALKEA